MRLDDQRRSENIEDRRGQGGGRGGGFGGGLPLRTGGIGLGGLIIVAFLMAWRWSRREQLSLTAGKR